MSFTSTVDIKDSFKIIGGLDNPPDKKNKCKNCENCNCDDDKLKPTIPINESDIAGLDYISE